jgi:hypothetical protein
MTHATMGRCVFDEGHSGSHHAESKSILWWNGLEVFVSKVTRPETQREANALMALRKWWQSVHVVFQPEQDLFAAAEALFGDLKPEVVKGKRPRKKPRKKSSAKKRVSR